MVVTVDHAPARARRWAAVTLALALVGCAGPRPSPEDRDPASVTIPGTPLEAAPEWREVRLPGKRATQYRRVIHDGRPSWHAHAEQSASLWRKPLKLEPAGIVGIEWSWWVDGLLPEADLTDIGLGDAPARLVFGFDGDEQRLSARNRMMFELARALSGEAPPYATLMYVWDNRLPVGTVIVHPRTDRIRKLVVESGAAHLRQWRHYRRDLRADFRQAFGEEPGPLLDVAYMTDADNTASRAQAWYGDLKLDRTNVD